MYLLPDTVAQKLCRDILSVNQVLMEFYISLTDKANIQTRC